MACCRCGAAAARVVFTSAYCSECWNERLLTFSPWVLAVAGVGMIDGRHRPEYGRHMFELCCSTCRKARWVGTPGDRCPWCHDREAHEDAVVCERSARAEEVRHAA